MKKVLIITLIFMLIFGSQAMASGAVTTGATIASSAMMIKDVSAIASAAASSNAEISVSDTAASAAASSNAEITDSNTAASASISTATKSVAAPAAVKTNILELSDIKIVMDGRLTKFNDVPVSVASNTLLPLREMLVKLGVPNDDEHIKYNNEEKSVTVSYEGVSIYLSVGSKTAYVNSEPILLNAAPLLYSKNQKIYIPFRFVAEAIGKKVVWDGSSRTIYVCSEASYDNVRTILKKSDEAMKNSLSFTQNISMVSNVKSSQGSIKFNVDISTKLDKLKRELFMTMNINMLGIEMTSDTYYADNVVYSQDPINKTWKKTLYEKDEYQKLFDEQCEPIMLGTDDPLCAGLCQSDTANSNEILLKGDVFLIEAMTKALDSQKEASSIVTEEDMEFDEFNMEVILDSSTYRINSIVIKGSYGKYNNNSSSIPSSNHNNISTATDVNIKADCSDYDADYQIVVPTEIKDSAAIVERDTATPVNKNGFGE